MKRLSLTILLPLSLVSARAQEMKFRNTIAILPTDFRGGKGDIVKDLAASCKKSGLKQGIYLSPADLHQIKSPEGLYGNLSKPSVRTIPTPVEGRPFANKTKFEFKVDDYN